MGLGQGVRDRVREATGWCVQCCFSVWLGHVFTGQVHVGSNVSPLVFHLSPLVFYLSLPVFYLSLTLSLFISLM